MSHRATRGPVPPLPPVSLESVWRAGVPLGLVTSVTAHGVPSWVASRSHRWTSSCPDSREDFLSIYRTPSYVEHCGMSFFRLISACEEGRREPRLLPLSSPKLPPNQRGKPTATPMLSVVLNQQGSWGQRVLPPRAPLPPRPGEGAGQFCFISRIYLG